MQNRYYPFEHEFNLNDALADCRLVFEGIKDDESFQKCDWDLVLGYANEIMYALRFAVEHKDKVKTELMDHLDGLISELKKKSNLSSEFRDGVEDGYLRVKSDLRWLLPNTRSPHNPNCAFSYIDGVMRVGDLVEYSYKSTNIKGVVTRRYAPTRFTQYITLLTASGKTVRLNLLKGEWRKTSVHFADIEEICK